MATLGLQGCPAAALTEVVMVTKQIERNRQYSEFSM
jgi:hypothetical protein